MTINEVLAGGAKRIRRKCWEEGQWMGWNENWKEPDWRGRDGELCRIDPSDLRATDWEVWQPPKKEVERIECRIEIATILGKNKSIRYIDGGNVVTAEQLERLLRHYSTGNLPMGINRLIAELRGAGVTDAALGWDV